MNDTSLSHEHQSDGTLGEISGTGVGLISGGVVGASVAGPIGAVVGAVLGGVLGAAAGGSAHEIGEDIGPGQSEAERLVEESEGDLGVTRTLPSPTGTWIQADTNRGNGVYVAPNPQKTDKTILPDPETGLPGLFDDEETDTPVGPDLLGP